MNNLLMMQRNWPGSNMNDNPYASHVEESVSSAHPVELVALLFGALGDSIRQGRLALAKGEIAARASALSRSLEILAELANSVDRNQGGELSTRLLSIYAFAAERIQQSNFLQSEAPLIEVERVLQPISEAWEALAKDVRISEGQTAVYQVEGMGESAPLSLCG